MSKIILNFGQAKGGRTMKMQPAKMVLLSNTTPTPGSIPPTSPAINDGYTPKRRGRPRKKPEEKALVTLSKIADDVVTLIQPEFDGGGTAENTPIITKESLERRVARRLNILDRYLTEERMIAVLEKAPLREIGVYEGIMMDKSLILQGQPTVIVGNDDRANIEQVLPKLLNELRRRKLITSVSERKIEFKDV